MTISKTTVTGPIFLPNCEKPEQSRIVFELSSWDREDGEATFVSGPYVGEIDENGDFSVELYSNTEGENGVVYRASVVYLTIDGTFKREFLGSFSLTGVGPIQLSEIEFTNEFQVNTFDVLSNVASFAASARIDAEFASSVRIQINEDLADILIASGDVLLASSVAVAAKNTAQAVLSTITNLPGDRYETIAEGVDVTNGVASGEYFILIPSNPNESIQLYLNNAGTASLKAQYPSNSLVRSLEEKMSIKSKHGYPADVTSSGGHQTSTTEFVFADPVTKTGQVKEIEFWAESTTSFAVKIWSRSGSVFTLVDSETVTPALGRNILDTNLEVVEGYYIGFYGGSVSFSIDTADGSGWYGGSEGVPSDSTTNTGARLFFRYTIWESSTGFQELSAYIDDVEERVGVFEDRAKKQSSNNLYNPLAPSNTKSSYIVATVGSVAGGLDNFAVVGACAVTAGKKYRIDLKDVINIWKIYEHPSASIHFYSDETITADNNVKSSPVGVDDLYVSPGGQYMTFTVPAGASHVGFTANRISETMYDADYEELFEGISMTEGWGDRTMEYPPVPEEVQSDVVVQKEGDFLYTRTNYRPGSDLVTKLNVGYGESTDTNGVIDIDGMRLIATNELLSSTKEAWEASNIIINYGGDSSPPFKFNYMYLGGGHGIVSTQINKVGHGKTNADVGSTYVDDSSKNWIITKRLSADAFVITAENTGTADSWFINGSPSGDLTHVSDGTDVTTVTPDSIAGYQLAPITQDYRLVMLMDDKHRITEDGVYVGSKMSLIESYGIPNAASVLDDVVLNVGSLDNPVYNKPSIPTQIDVQTAYTLDFSGIFEVVYTTTDLQEYYVNYHGGMQHQKMNLDTPDNLTYFVPRCSTGSFATGFEQGNILTTQYVVSADFDDQSNPPDRFYQIVKRGAIPRHGFMIGYSKNTGLDRSDLSVAFFTPSSSLKMYPYAVDDGTDGTTATPGTVREVTGFFGAFDPNRDQDFSAKVLFRDAGKHSLYLHGLSALTNKWVSLPERFIGLPVTVTHSVGITTQSTIVSTKGVLVNSTSGGELEILIG